MSATGRPRDGAPARGHGTPAELMARAGTYAELFARQAAAFADPGPA